MKIFAMQIEPSGVAFRQIDGNIECKLVWCLWEPQLALDLDQFQMEPPNVELFILQFSQCCL